MTESIQKESGFTLIEILVALAILGSILVVLSHVISAEARSSTEADSSAKVVLVAQSLMDRIGRDLSLASGEQSGAIDGGGHWLVRIRPLTPAEGATPGVFARRAYMVEVTIDRAGLQPLRLTSIRLFGQ